MLAFAAIFRSDGAYLWLPPDHQGSSSIKFLIRRVGRGVISSRVRVAPSCMLADAREGDPDEGSCGCRCHTPAANLMEAGLPGGASCSDGVHAQMAGKDGGRGGVTCDATRVRYRPLPPWSPAAGL